MAVGRLPEISTICAMLTLAAWGARADELTNPAERFFAALTGDWSTPVNNRDILARGERWRVRKNERGGFLDLNVETIVDGAVAYKGAGFILHDEETHSLRIYLMMNNGALHESIGEQTGDNSYRFIMTTYGVPNTVFPDMKYDLTVTPKSLTSVYAPIGPDGAVDEAHAVTSTLKRVE